MSYDLLVPDKRHSTDFDRPLPPYYKREASLNQLSVSTAVAIFHRILKQQSLKNEFYKIAMCSFLGVGIFSKHSHTSMYSQHWKICVAFLWAHITLAVSRFNSIYQESNVYAFEQKQRFYSPILYTIVHSMFDLVWDGLLSISFSTFLYLLLTSVDYGLKDHIPAEFMLFWGASMQLSLYKLSRTRVPNSSLWGTGIYRLHVVALHGVAFPFVPITCIACHF